MQIKPTLPVPALRLVVVTNLIGEAALLLFHAAPLLVAAQVRRWRRRSWPQPGLPAHGPGDAAAASAKAVDGCCSSSESSEAAGCPPDGDVEQAAGSPPQQHSSPGQPDEHPLQQQQQRRPAPLAHAKTSVRPPLPLARGLSSRFERWEAGRPLLRRRLALAAIVVSFMGCCSLHILAPGFVDVSIVVNYFLLLLFFPLPVPLPGVRCLALGLPPAVPEEFWRAAEGAACAWRARYPAHQPAAAPLASPLPARCRAQMLTTQWTPLFIAAVQSLLLRKPLPRAFWPSAAVILGGAGMVIVPAVSQVGGGWGVPCAVLWRAVLPPACRLPSGAPRSAAGASMLLRLAEPCAPNLALPSLIPLLPAPPCHCHCPAHAHHHPCSHARPRAPPPACRARRAA